MKRFLVTVLLILTLAAGFMPSLNAAVTPGSKCVKVGQKQTQKGKVYTCIKLGSKLYWNNGTGASSKTDNQIQLTIIDDASQGSAGAIHRPCGTSLTSGVYVDSDGIDSSAFNGPVVACYFRVQHSDKIRIGGVLSIEISQNSKWMPLSDVLRTTWEDKCNQGEYEVRSTLYYYKVNSTWNYSSWSVPRPMIYQYQEKTPLEGCGLTGYNLKIREAKFRAKLESSAKTYYSNEVLMKYEFQNSAWTNGRIGNLENQNTQEKNVCSLSSNVAKAYYGSDSSQGAGSLTAIIFENQTNCTLGINAIISVVCPNGVVSKGSYNSLVNGSFALRSRERLAITGLNIGRYFPLAFQQCSLLTGVSTNVVFLNPNVGGNPRFTVTSSTP